MLSGWLRKLRGILGLGLVWAGAWAILFAMISVVVGIIHPPSIDAGEGPLRLGGIGAMVGFFSGVCFGAVLALAERRKGILELSRLRAALWGAIAGTALPLLTPINNSVLANTIPIGAVFAVLTVSAARRAELSAYAEPEALPD